MEKRSTITSGGIWLWRWRRFGEPEAARDLCQRLFGEVWLVFSLPEASLYRGPFTKVVQLDLTVAVGSPTFNKIEPPVFTMLVPGSIASIHSLDVISRNIGHNITL